MALLTRRRTTLASRPSTSTRRRRSLQGSATVVDLGNKIEASKIARARQAWQSEAWMYRRALPECRYAVAYIGNSCMRMKLFPGLFVGDHEVPVPVGSPEADELPPDLVQDAHEALEALKSGGPLALPLLFKKLSEHFEVAGEAFLIGETDIVTGLVEWSIRSTNEMFIKGEKYGIRDTPTESAASSSSATGVRWLPEGTFISRLWWPDPEFGFLADSPFQSIREQCEELMLMSKEIRALSRNRLANSGLLLLSDELSVVTPGRQGGDTEGGDDDDEDPFFREFVDSAQAALTNEGSAASVAPIIGRGPAAAIQNGVRFLSLQRPLNSANAASRSEVIGRMATGLDLPNEVLLGKADLNHWASWQISDDTFKHHIEPIVIVMCDALTAGYLWPMLEAKGHDPALVRQVLVWYDPTELVTHPDRSQDAFQAWDRLAISDKALRNYLGFPDDDAPLPQEILIRLSTHVRSLDPAIQTAILKLLDPALNIPVLQEGGTVSAPPGGEGDAAATPPAPAGAPIGSDANPGPPSTGGANGSTPTPQSVSGSTLAPGPFAPSGIGPFAPEYQAQHTPESAALTAEQRELIRATVAAIRSRSNGERTHV